MVQETSGSDQDTENSVEENNVREKLRRNRVLRNRRQFMSMIGAAGAAGLAGCSGGGDGSDGSDGGDGGDGSDGDSGPDRLDRTFRAGNAQESPTEAPLNGYQPTTWSHWWAGLQHLFRRPFYYSVDGNEWVPGLAEDWSIDDGVVTVDLADGYTWTNGREVDAQDFADKYTIEIEAGFQTGDIATSAEAVDDSTVEITLNEESADVNPAIIAHTLFSSNVNIDTPREVYGDIIDGFREAETQEETDAVLTDLTEGSWDLQDEWIYNGPWDLESADETRVLLTPRDEDPASDGINFSTWEIPVTSDQEAEFLSGSVDAAYDQDPSGAAEEYDQLGFVPVFNGIGVAFNHGDDWFGDRDVRKAISYMIDNERYKQAVRGGKEIPMDIHTGMAREYAADRMGDVADSLTDYSAQNADLAAEHLQAAGFTQEDGTWYDADGNEFVPEYVAEEGDAQTAQFVANAIQNFGVNAEARVESSSTYDSLIKDGDWQMTRDFWYFSWFVPIPYDNFRNALQGRAKEIRNIESEWEIPMPPGDPDGDLQTINVDDKLSQLRTAEGEEASRLVRELGWAWNQYLPMYQVYTYGDTFHFNTDGWNYPDEDHRVWTIPHPPYLLAQWGLMEAEE